MMSYIQAIRSYVKFQNNRIILNMDLVVSILYKIWWLDIFYDIETTPGNFISALLSHLSTHAIESCGLW